ncbi:MAG: tripartite tricarboxylate transporter permease [Hyphomicrobiales bacterium]|nr:tripartite tricarboxylate transporter permease [Hyphomicrobiales bacterium]
MDFFTIAVPALSEAFGLIFSIQHLGYLALGVVLGLCVGVFPGLGGIAGLSMLLPFLYGIDPISGLAMMVGLVAVIPTSDTFSSVLMGIPGSSSSQATVLDGFPLSKQGEAARALAAAFTSSLFGGLFGALILTFFVLLARPLILSFRTPELLMLTILGLSMVGALAGRSLLKGLVAAGLGLTIGAMGEAPAQGTPRMDFGSWYLQDGLQLVIVGLGIFAVPEIVALLRQDRSISETGRLGAGYLDGVRDWWRNKWLSLRCAGIGTVVGVIPGLGGSVVDWIAYGHAVQTTKDRSKFGAGEIRGIIAPESSNNAKEGGGLVPTLLFGIPGSGSMAVFLGGMILLGLEAGPSMISSELNTTYTIVWSLALANVVGAGLCVILSGHIARLTTIPFPILAPFLFMMICFAAFQSKQTLWDLAALVAIGLLGVFMRRFDWPRPAFLIGFVLANQAEVYTYQAVQFGMRKGFWDYFATPTVGILLVITVVSVWLGARQSSQIMEAQAEEDRKPPPESKTPALIFAGLIVGFLVVAVYNAVTIDVLIDKVFPLAVSGFTLAAAALVLLQMLRAPNTAPVIADQEQVGEDATAPYGLWQMLAWLLGLIALTALVGFVIALSVFFVLFLRLRAGQDWTRVAMLTTGGLGVLLALAWALNRDFPPGYLQELADLPWPFK